MTRVRARWWAAFALGAVTVGASPLRGDESAVPASVAGVVVDGASGQPVAGAQVTLAESGRRMTTTMDGRFALAAREGERLTVVVRRIGYAPLTRVVTAGAATRTLRLPLVASALQLAGVVVTGTSRLMSADATVAPIAVLDGEALDRALGGSIAATVAGLPGVTQRTNGPMAAQPVIRGLTGDRVLVLEDGLRTGDIATTAPDHAVTIDPITAQRVEVVRGPAALAFNSATLGGVVNVIREDVPRAVPPRPALLLGVQGESMNRGGTVGGSVTAGAGGWAVRLGGSARTAGDSRTPRGALPFTDSDGFDVGLGVGREFARGHVGAAVRDYRTYYGVPSSAEGVTLPGSHVGGVYVDLRRTTARVEGEWRGDGAVEAVRLLANGIRFEQEELEQGGFVGTRFGQLATSGELQLRHRGRWGTVPLRGTVGVWGQWRDFRAAGSFTGTRPAVQEGGAAYAIQEADVGTVTLSAGARFDALRIRPLDRTESRLLQGIRTRAFGEGAGSLGALWRVRPGVQVVANVARAFRPPAIEELFSAGPHLATYAYEVGNPSLTAERGVGMDVGVRAQGARVRAEVALFRNRIDGYVQQLPLVDPATGLPERDPRLRRYVVYRAGQVDAQLVGAEGRAQWEPRAGWAVDATVSWVRGAERGSGTPLANIPPVRWRSELRRDRGGRWFGVVGVEGAARQGHVPPPPGPGSCALRVLAGEATLQPAEFCPTPGFTLANVQLGRRFVLAGQAHAVTVAVDNVFDAAWRDHLWRAKQVATQPGRNVRLLYRVTW